MNEIGRINEKIWELWKKYPRDAGPVVPKFITEPIDCKLVFLGLNPSLPKPGKWQENHSWQCLEKRLKKLNLLGENEDYRRAFLWERIDTFNDQKRKDVIKLFADIHHSARLYYPKWFERLNSLATFLSVKQEEYGHIDCFLWADTNSAIIKKRVKIFYDKEIVTEQKRLFDELLAIHQPSIIVCVYKNLWTYFEEYCESKNLEPKPFETGLNQLGGFHVNFCWRKKQIPIFVCSDLPSSRNTMTAKHFSALCEKIKEMAGNHHPSESEENNFRM